jgi:hypothetical protein
MAADVGTNSAVASGTTDSTVILAGNTAREGATIWNASSAILYISFGAVCTPTNYSRQIAAGGFYEIPFRYTGVISGVWASANGSALVTELV